MYHNVEPTMKVIKIILITILMSTTTSAQKFIPIENDSKIKFAIKNFGLTVDGTFSGLTGTLTVNNESIEKSEIALSVNAASVNTENKARDKHLKNEDYFDVATHPLISFKSTKITKTTGLHKFVVVGNLTIKGITKPTEVVATITTKEGVKLIKGTFEVSRKTFKIGDRSMVLSDSVKLNVSISCKEVQP